MMYKAECDVAGMVIHIRAKDANDARDKLISSVGYWQAQKRYKTKLSDWKISAEEE
ncbi:MAG: hypothetical protein IJ880_17470 [Bacilli bacterium]|nr:hypothetical protein [Bacilli bacterium]